MVALTPKRIATALGKRYHLHHVSAVIGPLTSIGIRSRLGCTPETWGVRMAKLAGGQLLGRFLAAPRNKLRELARKLQVRHLANVG
jgi:hypothetical protein